MLDIQLLRTDLENVAKRLSSRGYTFPVEEFNSLETERKIIQARTQELQAQRNSASKQIGNAKGKGENVSIIMAEVASLGDELKQAETLLEEFRASCGSYYPAPPTCPMKAYQREGVRTITKRSVAGGPLTHLILHRKIMSAWAKISDCLTSRPP